MNQRRRLRAENGLATPFELALGLGIMCLVILVISAFPLWLERRSVARSIAAETARAIVISEGTTDPYVLFRESLANLDQPAAEYAISVPSRSALPRNGSITVRVKYTVPAINVGSIKVGSTAWTVTHAEPLDPYRSIN